MHIARDIFVEYILWKIWRNYINYNMDCCLELRSAITFYFKMKFLTKEVLLGRMPMIEHKRTFLGTKWH